jgi:murein DD-endopeptidase MepM/ murein hydrolase activator NlpD
LTGGLSSSIFLPMTTKTKPSSLALPSPSFLGLGRTASSFSLPRMPVFLAGSSRLLAATAALITVSAVLGGTLTHKAGLKPGAMTSALLASEPSASILSATDFSLQPQDPSLFADWGAPLVVTATTAPAAAHRTAQAPHAAAPAGETGIERIASYFAKPNAVRDGAGIERRTVELKKGESLSDILDAAGVSATESDAALSSLRRVYNIRQAKAGQDFALLFREKDGQDVFMGVEFSPNASSEISVLRMADGSYSAQAARPTITMQHMAARGVISGSFFGAGKAAGVPHAIMASILKLYAYEIDFQRDLREGDRFEVLYDQGFNKKGEPVGASQLAYASLTVGGKTRPIFRFTGADGLTDYYDLNGQSVRRALLRTPVDGVRMTSGFGMRFHPVMGFSMMHKGVDFGASIGTPIYAAGSGVIEKADWYSSYGRYIRIKHNSKISTAYAHLNAFARNIKPGTRVQQGDIIGYVGMTGRSTGPHLHYETIVDGVQVNPLSLKAPTKDVLGKKDMVTFVRQRDALLAAFSQKPTAGRVIQAKN